jgi:hypothetical protein
MMRMMRPALLSALIVAVNLACTDSNDDDVPFDGGPTDASTPDLCSGEAPCAVTLGMKSSEYIAPEMDQDAFTFAVPSGGSIINVVVEQEATISAVDLEVVLFDPGMQSLATDRHSGNGRQRVEIQLVAPAAGEYRVVVRDVANDDQDRLNPYFITVQLLAETDQNEPNDVASEAKPLALGAASSGTIGFQGDEDWFSIDVPANTLLQIAMTVSGPSAQSAVKLRWALFDSTGTNQIALSDEPATGQWPIESRAVGNMPGTYLIRVIDDDGQDADLMRVYGLTVTFVSEPDAYDLAAPNEAPGSATLVTSGQVINGYVAATSDFDYYRIQVTNAPRLIVVRASMPASEVDLAFEVLGTNGRDWICLETDDTLCKALRVTRDGTEGATTLTTSHVAAANGTYYVLVRDHQDNDFDYQTPYQLTVDVVADPDPRETFGPDDFTSAILVPAVTSTLGTTITYATREGFIAYANDTDWYELRFPGPVNAPAGQNGDWRIEMHLENDGATPVELNAFFFGNGRDYYGVGQMCRDPMTDPNPCQFADAENALNDDFGEAYGDCFVVFREITGNGAHYFRMSDLDRDDYDLGVAYRFRVTITAGCPVPGLCQGVYTENGVDLCGRP